MNQGKNKIQKEAEKGPYLKKTVRHLHRMIAFVMDIRFLTVYDFQPIHNNASKIPPKVPKP